MKITIARDDEKLGEWTENEVRAFYLQKRLVATDLYWKEGMTEWAPLGSLITQAPSTLSPSTSVAKRTTNANIASGDGTEAAPFVLPSCTTTMSAHTQREVIAEFYGPQCIDFASREYSNDGSRIIWSFPHTGEPTIHFDSTAVTAFANSPAAAELRKSAENVYKNMKPADRAKMDALMAQVLGGAPPKKSGCMSVLMVAGVLGFVFLVHLI